MLCGSRLTAQLLFSASVSEFEELTEFGESPSRAQGRQFRFGPLSQPGKPSSFDFGASCEGKSTSLTSPFLAS